jgi:uroporphyrin-III C-methyltransferase/precorrin-2 dehydrogenase/sirohydrochlorin ferrochelatase
VATTQYPINLNLDGSPCLVVGGGTVASRRAAELVRAGARVTVVAPSVSPELEDLAARGVVALERREARDDEVTGAALVVVATDDEAVNRRVAAAARAAGALVTVADRPELCGFTMPAVTRRGQLTLTASTGGASPALSGLLGRSLAATFGPEWADVVDALEGYRAALRERFPADAARRKALHERALGLDLAAIARATGRAGLDARLGALLDAGPSHGTVYLVGAGPGDPGLMTVRGAQLLARAGAVVHDSLVAPELLALIPEHAERHLMGKRGGAEHRQASVPQQETNELLAELATRHAVVVRLKGGDPYLFGRGAEEEAYLRARGVPVEVVPGVSSAFAVPASAGIPITHRDHTAAVVIASGHRRADRPAHEPAQDWARFGALDATIVVLMGVGALAEISAGLVAGGRGPDTPAALVEWGTTPRQREIFATLGTVAALARDEGIAAPAVLVVGSVVALRAPGDRDRPA